MTKGVILGVGNTAASRLLHMHLLETFPNGITQLETSKATFPNRMVYSLDLKREISPAQRLNALMAVQYASERLLVNGGSIMRIQGFIEDWFVDDDSLMIGIGVVSTRTALEELTRWVKSH